MRKDPEQWPRAAGDRGSAAMEMVLLLPPVFLLIALLFNMGSAWLTRMKTNTAVRFGATYYVHERVQGREPAAALAASEQAVRDYYFPEAEALELAAVERSQSLDVEENQGLFSGIAATVKGWLESFSSRQTLELSIRRGAPIGDWLPTASVVATFDLDGNTWTHSEIPLDLDALTQQISRLGQGASDGQEIGGLLGPVLGWIGRILGSIVGAVFKGFFWLLGMIP